MKIMDHEARKGSALIILLCVLVIVVIAVAAVWYVMQNHSNSAGTCCDVPVPYATSSVQTVSATPSSTTSSSTITTTDWQTYTNQGYGYTMMYPPDWIVATRASTDTIIQFPSDSEGISVEITVDQNPNQLNPQEWAKQGWGDHLRNPEVTTTVGGYPAFEASAFDYDHEPFLVYLQHDQEMYQIEFDNYDLGLNSTTQAQFNVIFQKMISTFQFIK